MPRDPLSDDLRLLLLESVVDRLTEAGTLCEERVADELLAGGVAHDRAALVAELRTQRLARPPILEPAPPHGGPRDGDARATDPMAEVYRHLAAARRLDLPEVSAPEPAGPARPEASPDPSR